MEFLIFTGVLLAYIAIGYWSFRQFVKNHFGVIHRPYTTDDVMGAVILACVWPGAWIIYLGKPAIEWLIRNPPHTWSTTDEPPAAADDTPDILPPPWLPPQHGLAANVNPDLVLPPMPAKKDGK